MADHTIRYIRKDKTISGRLLDEMVMMDPDQGKYFSLNQSATAIWEILAEALTIEQICRKIQNEYEVNEEQCMVEVKDHLKEMERLGLILRL